MLQVTGMGSVKNLALVAPFIIPFTRTGRQRIIHNERARRLFLWVIVLALRSTLNRMYQLNNSISIVQQNDSNGHPL